MEFTKEREISISKLFWKVLLAWRCWLAFGIIMAILLSSIAYMSSQKKYQEELLSYQMYQNGEAVEENKIVLTEEEMLEVEDVKILENQIARVREYVKESLYMKLESDNIYALVLQYYVNSDYTYNYTRENTLDYTSALTENYKNYVISGALAKGIKEELNFDVEEGYINELISVESTENTFTVKIFYSDIETLEQMAPIINKLVESRTLQLSKSIGSHKLGLVEMNISSESNSEISTRQKVQSDMIYNYTIQLNALKGGMTASQLEILDIKIAEENGVQEMKELFTKPVVPAFPIIYAIFGFVIGAFFACVCLVFQVIFTVKVQDVEEIEILYDVRNLGEIENNSKKKKLFAFIDTLILKLKNRSKKQLTKEQQIRMICSNLEIACKKADIDKVYFTGSEIEKIDKSILSEIKKVLSLAGIQVCSGENISYDAKSLKEMAQIGHVVLVEQVGVSIYKEIEKEIKIARENSIDILGSIVID